VRSRRGLDVFAVRTRAGLLSRSDLAEAEYLFAYQAGCPPASAISLSMPVIADQYDSTGALHPIFEMNLPEGALLEKLRLGFAKAVPDLDELRLLAIVGQSQIGRLRYVADGEKPGVLPAQNLEAILRFDGAEDLFEDLMERYAVHSGVSGVQPKVLLRGAGAELARSPSASPSAARLISSSLSIQGAIRNSRRTNISACKPRVTQEWRPHALASPKIAAS
jgi:serine/threonine-protein kinase HipA